MSGVDKPVPKPRTIFTSDVVNPPVVPPPPIGFPPSVPVPLLKHAPLPPEPKEDVENEGRQPNGNQQVISTPPRRPPPPIGFKLEVKLPTSLSVSSSVSSSQSSLSQQSPQSAANQSPLLATKHGESSIDPVLNHLIAFNRPTVPAPAPPFAPPKLPPHFLLPSGPPPPIPPRVNSHAEPDAAQSTGPPPSKSNDVVSLLAHQDELDLQSIPEEPADNLLLENVLNDLDRKNPEHKCSFEFIDGVEEDVCPSASGDSVSTKSGEDGMDFYYPSVMHPVSLSRTVSYSPKADGESVSFSGWVKLKSSKKDGRRLWASLRHRQLQFMTDDEEESLVAGPFDLSRLLFIGRSTDNASDIIVVLSPPGNSNKLSTKKAVLLCFAPDENYDFWISLLAKCNCPSDSAVNEAINVVAAAGKVFIKEGFTGLWMEGYVFTKENSLFYWNQQDRVIHEVDIRKFTQLKTHMPLADYCNHVFHSKVGPLLIVLNASSLYLQGEIDSVTKSWHNYLQFNLRRSSRHLVDCRLTNEDIPVIIDRCIKFIATHGIKQPGIYRKNGPNTVAKKALEALKNDPYETHLSSDNDEEINAIADVLRTFLRNLERPLIPDEIQSELYAIADRYRLTARGSQPASSAEKQELIHHKSEDYKTALETMPKVHYNTLKRLIEHLIEVNSNEADNRASIDNLGRVFGPTVFTVNNMVNTDDISNFCNRTGMQIMVMKDLLELHYPIFGIPKVEPLKDPAQVFESACRAPKRSQGFLISIHLFKKDNQCFNVQSTLMAEQVVEQKIKSMGPDYSAQDYALFEVAKNGTLERRVGDSETINSIALERWIVWKAEDIYLVLKKERYPFHPANSRPFAEDIKVAEPGSKTFKSAQLRIQDGKKIQQFHKGEQLQKPQKEWIIDETIWFMGHTEERKNPLNYPYTTTFILKSGKYNTKIAGYCVAFSDEVQRNQWLNAVVVSQRDYSPFVIIPDL